MSDKKAHEVLVQFWVQGANAAEVEDLVVPLLDELKKRLGDRLVDYSVQVVSP